MAKEKKPVESKSSIRVDHCVTAARRVAASYDRWCSLDEPIVSWRGAAVKAISQDLHESIVQACNDTADAGREVDRGARRMVLLFDDLAREFFQWVQEASLGLDTAPPRGSTGLLNAIERVKASLNASRYERPAPIKQLYEVQRVSPSQIARIYGWKTEDGSEDVQKVFEEMENPGTHFDPKAWVHPAQAVEQKEVDARWAERKPREAEHRLSKEATNDEAPAPANPDLDTLLREGAPMQQIIRLSKQDEQFIEMYAAEQGYQRVGEVFVSKEQLAKDEEAKKFAETV